MIPMNAAEGTLVDLESRTCPLPTRRQRQAEQGKDTPCESALEHSVTSSVSRSPVRTSVKVLLLLVLALTTVALPMSGRVSAASSITLPLRSLGTPVGGVTWVSASVGPVDATSLSEEVAAASRTRVRSPLTVSSCISDSAADGTRTLTRADALYWPIAEGAFEISSPFGPRLSPITGALLMHEGIDMSAPMDEPLYSVADGVVTEVSENSRSGALVGIKHVRSDGSVFFSYYLHQYMDKILVKTGEHVTAGQRIGAVGSNGWSTGPHLHFEIHDSDDKPVDPQAWMLSEKAAYVGSGC